MTPSVLIVDDEAANRRLVREVLEPEGYRLREAEDGERAMGEIDRDPPDIVLLDVLMPGVDGYTVCRRLKRDPRTRLIPVVMVTSLDQLPDKLRAVDLGADDYLLKPFNPVELTARVKSLLSLKSFTDELENASRVLWSLALAIEARDACTGDHCRRMADSAVRLGQALGLGDEDQKVLRLGAHMHDLGKIGVSDSVLNKPGPLSVDEVAAVRRHAAVGYDLCKPMRTMEKVLPLIRHHHERLNGSGYPDGLKGDQIPLPVRIVTVADVFDALTSVRPYKKAFTVEHSIDILRDGAGRSWWDREVVEAQVRLVTAR